MCGICGIFGEGKKEVQPMIDVLRHRGPDGCGSYNDDYCSLGHTRLAIIDLSDRASQPMYNEDKTIWAVVNGEIYNYKDLREQFKDHVFISNCDSEVVIHAYERYGESFVNHFRGMFAFALYDKSKNKLILARDIAGKKPLYYWSCGKRLVFASEIKALFEAGVPKEINYDFIPSWLLYQYSIGDSTLFKGIKKLPPGYMLINDRLVRYWSPERAKRDYCRVWELRALLEESVRLRLQSDVPVGSFLSGGVDSSAVTALYRKYYTGEFHTFTASFDTFSESDYAKKVSDYLGTEYHEVRIDSNMVARDIEDVTWHHDEPLGDAAVLCNYYLAKEAKKYVSVVLAGEGGDEVFGGYPWYKYSSLIGIASKFPRILFLNGDPTKYYLLKRLMSILDNRDLGEGLLYPTTAMSKNTIRWILKECVFNYSYREIEVDDIYNRMLASDFLNLLPEKFLMKADKATMALAVEERLPLLDVKVVEYAFSLDSKYKRDKKILRESVINLIPEEIVWRPKQGFGTPVGKWLRDGLKEVVVDRLSNGILIKELCKKEAVDKLIKCLGKEVKSRLSLDPSNIIWTLFALQIWHDVWFGDKKCT